MADLGFEAALHRTVQRSRSEELTALASIRSRPFHTGGHLSGTWTRRISQQVIRVGVPFRTDSRGVAHTTHDLPGIRAINNIANIGRHVQFRVEPVTLPQGASGADTPERPDPPIDLYGIHILYIPGGPSANDTQVGNTQEEIDFQRAIVGRALAEHTSRSRYELRLIQIARTRGIPMLAVCAGSWRLLEAFGGQVRTLPDNLRTRHRNPDALWQTTHGVSIEARTLLRDILQVPSLANTNTTHWAVADTTSRDELVNRGSSDPLKGLQISARAYGQSLPRTVEGFETINGAMTLGIQWHPESSLPGMPGREVSPEQDKASDRLFRAYAISGQTRLRQNAVIAELHVRRLYVVLGMRDMAHAEAVWMDIYGYYGREPTQRDIDDYLRAFNLSYT